MKVLTVSNRTAEPTAQTPLFVVAAALTAADGRVLWQRRAAGGDHAGLWELPGGKVEAGEAHRAAIARELAEELGIIVTPDQVGSPCAVSVSTSPSGRIIALSLYRITCWQGDPRPMADQPLLWACPTTMDPLRLPPADRPFIPALARALSAPRPRP